MRKDKTKKEIQDDVRQIKNIELTKAEKEILLSKILSRTEMVAPAGIVDKNTETKLPILSTFWGYGNTYKRLVYATSGFVFVFAISGSLLSAANKSLPGDALYPIKVKVSEPIKGVLMTSDTEKMEWEVEKVNRRFVEMEMLIAQGHLDQKLRENAESSIEDSSERFSDDVGKMRKEGRNEDAMRAQIKLEATIGAHSKVLEIAESHVSDSLQKEVSKLKEKAEDKMERSKQKRSEMIRQRSVSKDVGGSESGSGAVASSSEEKAFENKRQSVSSKVEGLEKIISDKKSGSGIDSNGGSLNLRSDIIKSAESEIEAIHNELKGAEEKSNEGKSDEAFFKLMDSERKAAEVNIFLEQSSKFEEEKNRSEGRNRGKRSDSADDTEEELISGLKDDSSNSQDSNRGDGSEEDNEGSEGNN